ncbi:MAG: YdeI/OmpD-associated family protein [Candidatus Pacearchaeota archaeon]|jgi:uncharacterized protein YdeI (YjbR/CyaY-like superfamily)
MSNLPKTVYAKTIEEWRAWLQKNHGKENKIGFIRYKKHTGKPSLTHMEAMKEAICFGWIDTTINRLDDEKYIINFAKRNKNSKWSNNTLSYAKELIKQGKMSPAGLEAYKHGLSKPTHDFGIPNNPQTPNDLMRALKQIKADKNFELFPPSYKRALLRWLLRAKLPETRKRRINAIVNLAKNNDKTAFYTKKDKLS